MTQNGWAAKWSHREGLIETVVGTAGSDVGFLF